MDLSTAKDMIDDLIIEKNELIKRVKELEEFRQMAYKLGGHLYQALYADKWDTREYAIVACCQWEDEFHPKKTFAQQVDATVRDVVAMVNQGTADPNVVYPPGRYQGD